MQAAARLSRQEIINLKRDRKRGKRASQEEREFIARTCGANLIDSPCPLPFTGGTDGGDGLEYSPRLAQRYAAPGEKR